MVVGSMCLLGSQSSSTYCSSLVTASLWAMEWAHRRAAVPVRERSTANRRGAAIVKRGSRKRIPDRTTIRIAAR